MSTSASPTATPSTGHRVSRIASCMEEPPPPPKSRLARVISYVNAPEMDMFWGSAILLNSGVVAVDIEMALRTGTEGNIVLFWIQFGFIVLFSIEWLWRVVAGGCLFLASRWGVFDTFIVGSSIAEYVLSLLASDEQTPLGAFSVMRIVRLLRIARLIRVLQIWPEMAMLLSGLASSVKAVFWVFCFLVVFMYIGALVCALELGQSDDPDLQVMFGSVGDSFYAHFMVLTLEGYPTIVTTAGNLSLIWYFYFVAFILFSAVVLMNVVTGIVCESVVKAARDEEAEGHVYREESKLFQEVMTEFLAKEGLDLSEEITLKQFKDLLKNDAIREAMNIMEICLEIEDETLFHILDEDGNGSLTFEEFFKSMLRLRGSKDTVHSLLVQGDVIECGRSILKSMENAEADIQAGSRFLAETLHQRLYQRMSAIRKGWHNEVQGSVSRGESSVRPERTSPRGVRFSQLAFEDDSPASSPRGDREEVCHLSSSDRRYHRRSEEEHHAPPPVEEEDEESQQALPAAAAETAAATVATAAAAATTAATAATATADTASPPTPQTPQTPLDTAAGDEEGHPLRRRTSNAVVLEASKDPEPSQDGQGRVAALVKRAERDGFEAMKLLSRLQEELVQSRSRVSELRQQLYEQQDAQVQTELPTSLEGAEGEDEDEEEKQKQTEKEEEKEEERDAKKQSELQPQPPRNFAASPSADAEASEAPGEAREEEGSPATKTKPSSLHGEQHSTPRLHRQATSSSLGSVDHGDQFTLSAQGPGEERTTSPAPPASKGFRRTASPMELGRRLKARLSLSSSSSRRPSVATATAPATGAAHAAPPRLPAATSPARSRRQKDRLSVSPREARRALLGDSE